MNDHGWNAKKLLAIDKAMLSAIQRHLRDGCSGNREREIAALMVLAAVLAIKYRVPKQEAVAVFEAEYNALHEILEKLAIWKGTAA